MIFWTLWLRLRERVNLMCLSGCAKNMMPPSPFGYAMTIPSGLNCGRHIHVLVWMWLKHVNI